MSKIKTHLLCIDGDWEFALIPTAWRVCGGHFHEEYSVYLSCARCTHQLVLNWIWSSSIGGLLLKLQNRDSTLEDMTFMNFFFAKAISSLPTARTGCGRQFSFKRFGNNCTANERGSKTPYYPHDSWPTNVQGCACMQHHASWPMHAHPCTLVGQ